MTAGTPAPKEEKTKSRRNKEIVDENAPLIRTQVTNVEFDDFNGASFSRTDFNLPLKSLLMMGSWACQLPIYMCNKVVGVPGLLAILSIEFFTEKSIELMIRFPSAGIFILILPAKLSS